VNAVHQQVLYNGPRNKNPLSKELFTSLQRGFKMLAGLQGHQYFFEMFENGNTHLGRIFEFVRITGAMLRAFSQTVLPAKGYQ
jgi:hypothetical protein